MDLTGYQDRVAKDIYRKCSLGTIKILIGSEVLSIIENVDFQYKWDILYKSCPWATVFQSVAFVSTWYKLYHQSYLPILVMSENKNELTGLITLALPSTIPKHKKHFIIGAGHREADYQTWLAAIPFGNSFITAALFKIKEVFPKNEVMLRHLTPNTPLEWSKNNFFWKKNCVLHSFKSPLVNLNKFSTSKRDRKRIQRLNKISYFSRITNAQDFISILPELAANYDFRQGAMFNKNPFRNDPLNQKFITSLFEQNLLHLTVLKSNQKIIASVAVLIGKNKAHLGGINFHSPLYADYSPGFVHFLMLAQQMAAEGIESFDLTPGGDAYKDRLSTNHEEVHILVTTYSRLYYYKRQLKNHIYQKLIKAGIRPMTVELYLKRFLYTLRETGITNVFHNKVTNLIKKDTIKAYIINSCVTDVALLNVNKDNLNDLLDFESKGTRLTRWGFLEDAMRRLEAGEHVYTLARNGRLLACAWLRPPKAGPNFGRFTLPDGAVALHRIYCHPVFDSKLSDFLITVTQEVLKNNTNKYLFAFANDRNRVLSKALNLSGFRLINYTNLVPLFREGIPINPFPLN